MADKDKRPDKQAEKGKAEAVNPHDIDMVDSEDAETDKPSPKSEDKKKSKAKDKADKKSADAGQAPVGNKIKALEEEIFGESLDKENADPGHKIEQQKDLEKDFTQGDTLMHVLVTDDEEEISTSSRVLLYAIFLFFVSFCVWASYASVDQVTRGTGRVVPSSDIQILQSLEGGIIEEFMVREGDDVTAGQPIIRLRDVEATSDLESTRKRYLSLQAKTIRLRAQTMGADAPEFNEELMREVPNSVREEMDTFSAKQLEMKNQIQVLERQREQKSREVAEMRSRIKDIQKVIDLSRDEINMIEPLVERGSAPRVELLQLERGLKEREGELNSVKQSLPRALAAVEEADAKIEQMENGAKAQAQAELATTTIEMNSIEESLTALKDRQTRTEIRSPVTGTVKDLKISTVGGVVGPGEDLIEIVPKDDQLIIEAKIRPQDIAFLHPQQDAIIKITAYDYSIYGGLNGQVVDISADTIMDERGETFYRVRISTNQTALVRKGEVLPIIPGMVASVDILTGKKTIAQYILKPIIKTLGEAMSER